MPKTYFEWVTPFEDSTYVFTHLFESKAEQGHRLISFAMWGTLDKPCYAGVWSEDLHHGPQELHLGVDGDGVHDLRALFVTKQTDQAPVLIGAMGDWTGRTFAVVTEALLAPPAWVKVFTQRPSGVPSSWPDDHEGTGEGPLVYDEYENQPKPHQRGMLSSLAAYPYKDATLLAGIVLAQPKNQHVSWGYSLASVVNGLGAFDGAERHAALRRGWGRPDIVVPWHDAHAELDSQAETPQAGAVATVWRGDTFVPWPDDVLDPSFHMGAVVIGPANPLDVIAQVPIMEASGWQPWSFSASGVFKQRAAMVFVPRGRTRPLPKTEVVVDALDVAPPLRVPKAVFAIVHRPRIFSHALPAFDQAGGSVPQQGDMPVSLYAPSAATSTVLRYQALDDLAFGFLRPSHARCVHVAIGKNGELKTVRSYTLAEQNYRVLQVRDLLPIGSIAKWLCSIATIAHLAPNGTFAELVEKTLVQHLADIAGTPIVTPASDAWKLAYVNLESCLRHRTGFTVEPLDWTHGAGPSSLPEGLGVCQILGKIPPGDPGDYVSWLQSYTGPIFGTNEPVAVPNVPGTYFESHYEGLARRLMSELVSGKRSVSAGLEPDFTRYQDQMQSWWAVTADEARHFRAALQDRDEGFANPQAPVHSRYIRAGGTWRRKTLPEGEGSVYEWEPVQYAGDGRWSLGPGSWAMSAATLARVLSAMLPGSQAAPNGVPLLTPAQFALQYGGRGCIETLYTSEDGRNWRILWHNGGWAGCTTMAGHAIELPPDAPTALGEFQYPHVPFGGGPSFFHPMPHDPGQGTTSPGGGTTYTLVMMVGHDLLMGFGEGEMGKFLQVVLDTEEEYGLPEGDLFDVF